MDHSYCPIHLSRHLLVPEYFAITFAIYGKMTSTVIARKLERQIKSPKDEVALAQLFSSLLEMGKML